MSWNVVLGKQFDAEFDALSPDIQDKPIATTGVLKVFGPAHSRPKADTLKGSRHANMKELRFDADNSVWRAAFAFDPKRRASSSFAVTSRGSTKKAFYRKLIKTADQSFDAHLVALKSAG